MHALILATVLTAPAQPPMYSLPPQQGGRYAFEFDVQVMPRFYRVPSRPPPYYAGNGGGGGGYPTPYANGGGNGYSGYGGNGNGYGGGCPGGNCYRASPYGPPPPARERVYYGTPSRPR